MHVAGSLAGGMKPHPMAAHEDGYAVTVGVVVRVVVVGVLVKGVVVCDVVDDVVVTVDVVVVGVNREQAT